MLFYSTSSYSFLFYSFPLSLTVSYSTLFYSTLFFSALFCSFHTWGHSLPLTLNFHFMMISRWLKGFLFSLASVAISLFHPLFFVYPLYYFFNFTNILHDRPFYLKFFLTFITWFVVIFVYLYFLWTDLFLPFINLQPNPTHMLNSRLL